MTPNPRLADLDMSVRLQNICYIYNLKTLDDLYQYTRKEFAALRHVGRVTLAEVEDLLAKHGRRFWQEGDPPQGSEPMREDDFRALCDQAMRSVAADLRRIVEQLEQQNPGYTVVVRRFLHDEFEYELVPKESP